MKEQNLGTNYVANEQTTSLHRGTRKKATSSLPLPNIDKYGWNVTIEVKQVPD